MSSGPKLIVALDVDSAKDGIQLVERLRPDQCRLKVGKELFTSCGPSIVEEFQRLGFDIFLDLKFHDIPNTVAKAVKAAADLGVWMTNVHASGGPRMLEAAHNALAGYTQKPHLLAVTVLTSMQQPELEAIGLSQAPVAQVIRLAKLSKSAGISGVVCSAQEVSFIKEVCGDDFMCVTPGIRPKNASNNDQQRVMTPEQAITIGSDYLVVGRPITQADDPAAAAAAIKAEIAQAQLIRGR